ncbi:hypothetical protein GUJ93_ZPchr0004g38836 [Zizania palustris]|uniref:Uncharacterized protein n=1 Tax=Zizania palustris TaxID=103762 RepID=A0A8J5SJ86_ZIZPA|nr:hypothetical protein GUJ93_ZPchr0004g38836 [Zizania palustris]
MSYQGPPPATAAYPPPGTTYPPPAYGAPPPVAADYPPKDYGAYQQQPPQDTQSRGDGFWKGW